VNFNLTNIVIFYYYLYLSDCKSLYYMWLGLQIPATSITIFSFNEDHIRKDGQNIYSFLFCIAILAHYNLKFSGISHQITSSIFLFFSCNTLLKTDSEYEILSRIRMKPNFKSVLFLRFNSLEILK